MGARPDQSEGRGFVTARPARRNQSSGSHLNRLCLWSCVMSAPSIVPTETFYVVRDQYPDGDVFCETEVQRAHFEEALSDLLSARYRKPIAVYAFNPEEGWSRDVSGDFARELQSLID